VFFTGPIWVSILIPIVFATVLLIASLAIRPGRAGLDKSAFLSAAGLGLALITGGPWLAAVLVGFVLFTHWIGLTLERAVSRGHRAATPGTWSARTWLVVAVAVHVTTVVLIVRASLIAGPRQGIGAAIVPFGASYFAFHGISYVVDVYRRRVAGNRSRCQLAVYLMLLPMIVGAPLIYGGVAPHLAQGWPGLSDYSYGVRRLVIGVWKVFVMADVAGRQADVAFGLRPDQLNAFQAWVGLASFTLQIYYGFSGFSDMGVGSGRMLGLRLPENFRWPYVGQTVGEFWRRWHLGLSAWFREYTVQSPDGDRLLPPSASREALVVLLCGIWYGAEWTFVAWGLYHAALIAAERAGMDAAVKRLPVLMRHVYLILAVMVGWVILRSQTLGGGLLFLKALAGLNPSSSHAAPAIELAVWLVLLAGAIGCAPLSQAIRRWTVTIDALILSLLMLLSAPVLFAWRSGSNVVTPMLRLWRASRSGVGGRGGSTS
jgi:D-alanyl-lipoteichoic acid acyltransferase DltB (MBOAT superfamily)